MSAADERRQDTTATGILESIEDFFGPVLSVCAPIRTGGDSGGGGEQWASGRRGVRGLGALSQREHQDRTARLMQHVESEAQGAPFNAERDGVWFVENYKDDQAHYAFPKTDYDVLVRSCAGLIGKTTVVLSQPCRMLAVSKCKNVKVLLDHAEEEILVRDCENVEIIVGNDAPKIGVLASTGVKLVCSSSRNVPPPIETRQSTDVTCQCAMTRPGLCSASEVEKAPKFNGQVVDGNNSAVGSTQAVQQHFASHPDAAQPSRPPPSQAAPGMASAGVTGPPVSSFGMYIAQHDFNATQDDEITLRKGQVIQVDGLGDDHGWLTAKVPSHHTGHYGDGRGVVPTTHISAVEKCEVKAIYDYQGR
jgi:hypothetical protein